MLRVIYFVVWLFFEQAQVVSYYREFNTLPEAVHHMEQVRWGFGCWSATDSCVVASSYVVRDTSYWHYVYRARDRGYNKGWTVSLSDEQRRALQRPKKHKTTQQRTITPQMYEAFEALK